MILGLLGIASGIVLVVGDIPYAVNAYRRKTQPHRVTWFIISVLNIIGFANQAASGASNSLWLFGGSIIAAITIFILSLSRGVRGYSKLDVVVLSGALLGLLLWWWFHTPLASIIANVVVGMLGLTPTFIKSYRHPASETKITWVLGCVSNVMAIISIGKLDLALFILPTYSFIAQLLLIIMIELGTRRENKNIAHTAKVAS